MSEEKSKIKLFEERQVRTVWDDDAEKWWFSVVDICAVLTDSDYQTARKYWKVLKGRLTKEGNESVTNCYQLKMQSADGKFYLTDVADTEQVLRLVQSVPIIQTGDVARAGEYIREYKQTLDDKRVSNWFPLAFPSLFT